MQRGISKRVRLTCALLSTGEVLCALLGHVSAAKQALWGGRSGSDENDSGSDEEPLTNLSAILDPVALSSLEGEQDRQGHGEGGQHGRSGALKSLLCNRSIISPSPQGTSGQGGGDKLDGNGGQGPPPPKKRRRKRAQSQPSGCKKKSCGAGSQGTGAGPSGPGAGYRAPLELKGYTMPQVPVDQRFDANLLPSGDSLRALQGYLDKHRPF